MSHKPDFFIVGAPRSATTAMAQFLSVHPDIFMARKEMHVFGSDLQFGRRFYRRDLRTYEREFAARNGHRLAGEASVWYLFSNQAAKEIKQFNPDARIIIMLREPVEMLFSLYHEFRFDGNENLPSFEAALVAEAERRSGKQLTRKTYFAQGLVYREVVRYAEQIQRYFKEFGPDRVHVIIYDDFAADPSGIYRRTLEFLGLRDPTPACTQEFEVVNGSKRVRSALLQTLLGDRWLRSTAINVARQLPRPLFRFFQSTEERVWRFNARFVKRPPLAPELREQLKRQLAGEIEQVGQLLHRDLSRWSSAVAETSSHIRAASSPLMRSRLEALPRNKAAGKAGEL